MCSDLALSLGTAGVSRCSSCTSEYDLHAHCFQKRFPSCAYSPDQLRREFNSTVSARTHSNRPLLKNMLTNNANPLQPNPDGFLLFFRPLIFSFDELRTAPLLAQLFKNALFYFHVSLTALLLVFHLLNYLSPERTLINFCPHVVSLQNKHIIAVITEQAVRRRAPDSANRPAFWSRW